ncbi:putative ribonuclease H-like domain-containing protein [Tanacetum coccineum]
MKPFGCPVTILNIIDHLGSGPKWLFDIDILTKSMNYKRVVAGNQSNSSAGTKDSPDAGFKPSGEEEKKDVEDLGNEDSEVLSTKELRVNQEKDANVNNTNNINTVSSTNNAAGIEDNVVDENIVYGCANDSNMPNFEEIVYSDDDEDVDAEADMNNLDAFIPVSPIPTTRVHKDHPVEQIIEDFNFAPQTRRMTKKMEEHGFEDPEFPDRVYKVEKALYGLHQAPRAWYETLSTYLLDNGFQRVQIDKTLFIKKVKGAILLVQVCVDDIIFGSTKKFLCTEFEKLMHKKFQLSLMGELTFFLGASLDRNPQQRGFSFQIMLISWQCKKQTVVDNSIIEAEYIAASNCCGQFWATAKATTVNEECQIQALLDKKKVIITEMSVRSDLKLKDAEAPEELGEGSEIPSDPHHTPTTTQPSTSKSKKKQYRRKQRKYNEAPQLSGLAEPVIDDTKNVASVPTHSNDPLLSARRVESSNDASFGAQEDASKQGRKIADIDQDAEVTLVDETQRRNEEKMLFDVNNDLQGEEIVVEKEVAEKEVSTTDPVTTGPKAKGVVMQEPSKTTTTVSMPSKVQDKGKGIMVEEPLKMKKKDQIMFDEEVARNLEAKLQAELEEEERVTRQREEEANLILWDNTQSMMEAYYELAARLQAKEQGELTVEEKSRLFVELMNKRKKHFTNLRAKEIRRKPPTKA